MILFISFKVYGQADYTTLIINFPESAKDTFEVELAQFSTVTQDSLSGELLLCNDGFEVVTDGCTPIFQDMTGYIALIDRGQCAFVDKVEHAKEAGAIAVVICNHEPGGEVFAMGGEADFGSVIAVMLSYEDCMTVKAYLDDGISITMNNYVAPCDPNCAQKAYPENTVWGQNGEGSFACGLGEWTTVGISNDTTVWVWDKDGEPVGQTGAPRQIDSETVCNGAALMDFTNYTFDQNPNPVTPFPIHHSDLISPIIDLTDISYPVVNFTQYLNTFTTDSEIAFITFSKDGGNTWMDTIPIHTNNFINPNGISDWFVSENLYFTFCGESFGNNSQARIKFIANGNFYFWTLDDIYITNEAFQDIWIDPEWVGGLPNYQTPTAQIDNQVPIAFKVTNEGNIAYEDLTYTVTIRKEEEVIFEYEGTLNIGTCGNAKEVIVPELWNASKDIGNYQVTIELTDEVLLTEENMEDNKVTKSFKITERMYSKIDKYDNLFSCYSMAHNNTIANAYYINNAEGSRPLAIVTGISGGNVFGYDHHFIGEVREWVEDINADGKVDIAEETSLIASGELIYGFGSFNVDLQDFRIPLKTHVDVMQNDRHYLAIVHHVELNNPNPEVCANERYYKLGQGNPSYNHLGAAYAFEEVLGQTRPIAFASFGQTTLDNYDSLVLSDTVSETAVWFVDLELEFGVNTEDVSEDNQMSVYPNPFSNQLQVSEQVESYQVYTLQGEKVIAGSRTSTIDTDNWDNGIYLLCLKDKDGNQEVHKVVKE